MSRPPLVQITNATVRRQGHDILHIDSFVLEEGSSAAILGPNGSGKSTLVNLVTREVSPLHREIAPVRFRGQDRMTLEELKLQIGFVSATMQDQIRVHLTALEIVCGGFFGSLGVPTRFEASAGQRAHALATMEQIGIGALAERDMTTLSTGQVRRVLIARALVHEPRMLVLDEPSTGLDPNGMHYVRKTMRSLVEDGRSILLVTHYPEDIVPGIESIVYIKDGTMIGQGDRSRMLQASNLRYLFDLPDEWPEKTGCP